MENIAEFAKKKGFERKDLANFIFAILYSRIDGLEVRKNLERISRDYWNKVGGNIDYYSGYLNDVDLSLLKYGAELMSEFKIKL